MIKHPHLVILGAGGAGRTAASIAESQATPPGPPRGIAFLDDAPKAGVVNGYPVLGPVEMAMDASHWAPETRFVVAIGSTYMRRREELFQELVRMGRPIATLVHRAAIIDRLATVGEGSILAAQTVVHPNARIGANCFICVSASIDHDCLVGDNVYFSPGARLAGGVSVGNGVFIGTNASVLPCVSVGDGAVVGAGAVVRSNVDPGETVVGVPARAMTK